MSEVNSKNSMDAWFRNLLQPWIIIPRADGLDRLKWAWLPDNVMPMRCPAVLFLFTILLAGCASKPMRITGNVKYQSGDPVPRMTVEAISEPKVSLFPGFKVHASTTTDSHGDFEIVVPSQHFEMLFFKANGFPVEDKAKDQITGPLHLTIRKEKLVRRLLMGMPIDLKCFQSGT